ncbi:MAG: hypothetical protein K9L17_08870 [Clostridiales bacterium]|nr:hypothetical protein [Clostridiales bacterium]MCF8022789.1 hypothetical protein [Clostridiales bacterium]
MIIRHDVDRQPKNALKMAKLENLLGICSTYYFRYPKTYNLDIIKTVNSLGHEVGYHYEVLDKAKGDYDKAIKIFENELKVLREDFDIKTICMHGNPLTKWDGKDLWNYYNYRDFGIIGEAFLSCKTVSFYFTDTGRSWCSKLNMKDNFELGKECLKVCSSLDLIQLLQSCRTNKNYITVHPERWSNNLIYWTTALARDVIFNTGKKILQVGLRK